jgi:hypothetical protein
MTVVALKLGLLLQHHFHIGFLAYGSLWQVYTTWMQINPSIEAMIEVTVYFQSTCITEIMGMCLLTMFTTGSTLQTRENKGKSGKEPVDCSFTWRHAFSM